LEKNIYFCFFLAILLQISCQGFQLVNIS